MPKTTKNKQDQAKFALRRLAEDEEVHAHLRTAAVRAREAWVRASRRPGAKAVEDKKIYDKVREAATSLTHAGQKLQRKPEPPKHRARNAALVVAGASGAAYAFKKRKQGSTDGGAVGTPASAGSDDREPTPSVTG